jgi:hypothetical protein
MLCDRLILIEGVDLRGGEKFRRKRSLDLNVVVTSSHGHIRLSHLFSQKVPFQRANTVNTVDLDLLLADI